MGYGLGCTINSIQPSMGTYLLEERKKYKDARTYRRSVLKNKRHTCSLEKNLEEHGSQVTINQLQYCSKKPRQVENVQHNPIAAATGKLPSYDLQSRHINQRSAKSTAEVRADRHDGNIQASNKGYVIEPKAFRPPNKICTYCDAVAWQEERSVKSRNTSVPKFSICCGNGKVKLPLFQETPQELDELLDYNGDQKFRESIRAYNSIFSFTSIGGKSTILSMTAKGPYIFKISGQNHHKSGSLLPLEGQQPKFSQLYMYDGENELSNRMGVFLASRGSKDIDSTVVETLIRVFDVNNELVKSFCIARQRFRQCDYNSTQLRLFECRTSDGRETNIPNPYEVTALIVADDFYNPRDVVVDNVLNDIPGIEDSSQIVEKLNTVTTKKRLRKACTENDEDGTNRPHAGNDTSQLEDSDDEDPENNDEWVQTNTTKERNGLKRGRPKKIVKDY
ncbi:hypothetical protein RJ639_029694 [Escallonia herrerae]|uniref:Helitron helicase-like domain-containing protein n=1 Tax=Escallonia herrerae TaxID=1293975 RepID=A0AA88X0D9_9ASTE|nr:hypothetical protein RJ639_029694 [Escallonia herrerae]